MEDDFLKITESINKIESNYEKVKEIFFPEEILFDYNNSEQILKNDNFEIKIK
ncbi:MAG: hypothetical protein P1U46_04155 [Patescibacteria group bacterium]|nr:hypothetical protein [Patescibacteria group bacterium]